MKDISVQKKVSNTAEKSPQRQLNTHLTRHTLAQEGSMLLPAGRISK